MKALHHLIHSMSTSERRMFHTSLTSGSFRTGTETKTLQLFEILLKSSHEIPSNEDCSLRVYGKRGDKRFKMLKLRFKAKLLDSLLNDINIERQSIHLDEFDHAGIKIRKKFAQFQQLYYTKGGQPIVMQILEDVISLSKKWENYNSLAESLKFKKFLEGFSKGEKEFDRLNKEIAYYERCNQFLNTTTDLYYRFMMKYSFQGNQEKISIQEFCKKSITTLKKYYSETRSANIQYYLIFFELGYFQNEKDYAKARKVCTRLLSVLNDNPAGYRKLREGATYVNMGQCDIGLYDYTTAVVNIRKAQQYYPKQGGNYSLLKEQEFLALLYGNNISEAELAVFELLKTTTAEAEGDFRLAKYEFYYAVVLFKKSLYKASYKILSRKHELSKDKIGWEIAMRILTIMTLVELDRLDDAAQQTAGLRKHMERHSKMKELRERDKTILKALQAMEKNGYARSKINANEAKLLDKLKSVDSKLRWEPVTPELIPFNYWMEKRYKGKVESRK